MNLERTLQEILDQKGTDVHVLWIFDFDMKITFILHNVRKMDLLNLFNNLLDVAICSHMHWNIWKYYILWKNLFTMKKNKKISFKAKIDCFGFGFVQK